MALAPLTQRHHLAHIPSSRLNRPSPTRYSRFARRVPLFPHARRHTLPSIPRLRPLVAISCLAATAVATLLLAALPPAALAGPPGAIGDMYVSSDVLGTTTQYDGTSGSVVGTQYASNAALGQLGIHFGETNGRVLIGHFSGGVEEFDAVTGAYIKTYNAAGGTQWAGIYAPNGNVYVGDWNTDDVREYDASTGALVGVKVTGLVDPADMKIGPDGDLYICEYANYSVTQVDANTGAFVDQWSLPFGERANDIEFPAAGGYLVTAMGTNVCHVFDAAKTLVTSFSGTGWQRPHGIAISPWDGNIYVVDGVTEQVHVFDPVTYAEITAAFLTPAPGGKIVDVVFRPDAPPVSVESSSWGGIKSAYR